MTPDVAEALSIIERLRELARKRHQKGRPVLARLRPTGASLLKWIQSEPVRIASAKLARYGYAVSSNRREWIESIDGAIVELKREADIAAEAIR